MKFQNPSIHHSKVNTHTDTQTDKPKAICPSNFFKVGGIKKRYCTIYGASYCTADLRFVSYMQSVEIQMQQLILFFNTREDQWYHQLTTTECGHLV